MNIEWSMPPRCDMCAADAAECYPPTNDKGYTGLCKDCFHIFYEENTHLFKHPNWVDIDIIDWIGDKVNGRHYGLINTNNIDSIHTSFKDEAFICYVHSCAGCLEFKYPTFDMCIAVKNAFREAVLGSVGSVYDIGFVRPLTPSNSHQEHTTPTD